MSFITRCPACGTAFKVVPDQLKISDGWVRCGQCTQVFDATLDLQPWWPGTDSVSDERGPGDPSGPEREDVVDGPVDEDGDWAHTLAQPLAEDWPAAVDAPDDAPAKYTSPEVEEVFLDAAPDGASDPATDFESPLVSEQRLSEWPESTEHAGTATALEIPEPEAQTDTPEAALESTQSPEAGAAAGSAAVPETLAFAGTETADKPSFVKQAERRAFWRRPGVRFAGATAALLLTLTLAGQVVWFERDMVAARVPALQAALKAGCDVVGCELQPPRAIDRVSIESSALLRQPGGRYTFDMVLKNAAKFEVATPSLELTLTDASDRVLVRRVLLVADWPQNRVALSPGEDRTVRLELELQGAEASVMTGYRALLFYP
jgi:predicted Zn finger-like uncharacterized protein